MPRGARSQRSRLWCRVCRALRSLRRARERDGSCQLVASISGGRRGAPCVRAKRGDAAARAGIFVGKPFEIAVQRIADDLVASQAALCCDEGQRFVLGVRHRDDELVRSGAVRRPTLESSIRRRKIAPIGAAPAPVTLLDKTIWQGTSALRHFSSVRTVRPSSGRSSRHQRQRGCRLAVAGDEVGSHRCELAVAHVLFISLHRNGRPVLCGFVSSQSVSLLRKNGRETATAKFAGKQQVNFYRSASKRSRKPRCCLCPLSSGLSTPHSRRRRIASRGHTCCDSQSLRARGLRPSEALDA